MWMKRIREFLEFMKEPMLAVLAALLISQFLVMHTKVPTGSMETTIMPGDHLVVNRIPTYYRDPKRGDIVVFQGTEEKLIKRVVGLPGDEVHLIGEKVYINDILLDESAYIKTSEMHPSMTNHYPIQFPYKVPENHYFLMGDNRGNSYDSRFFGAVSRDDILAIGAFKIWGTKDSGGLKHLGTLK